MQSVGDDYGYPPMMGITGHAQPVVGVPPTTVLPEQVLGHTVSCGVQGPRAHGKVQGAFTFIAHTHM